MSAGDPLLRVTHRTSNKGLNNGLDQTLGVQLNESLNDQGHLIEYRMGYTRHIFLCISPARPPRRGLKMLAGSKIGGTT